MRAGSEEAPSLDVSLCDRPDRLLALEADWERLRAGAAGHSAALRFDYAALAWSAMDKTRGEQLAVIEVRRSGDLVGVWPLFTYVDKGRTLATHLGSGSDEEYGGPLVRQDEWAPQVVEAAVQRALRIADVLHVYNVSPTSLVAARLRRTRRPMFVGAQESPVATLSSAASWDEWLGRQSHHFRQRVRQRRKRLGALGDLQVDRPSGTDAAREVVDWLFDRKQDWLAARGLGDSWVLDPRGRRFFSELSARSPSVAPIVALRLDGRVVAACLCLLSSTALEVFMTGFDPALNEHSPGIVVLEDCAKEALRAGVDLDFRLTSDDYKLRWADDFVPYNTFVVACSPSGLPLVVRRLSRRAVMVFRSTVGPPVKRRLARAKGALHRRLATRRHRTT